MSKYTTGELAKLCDVTVRAVQFYDKKELLIPTELTQGGRRLYSESDLEKLKLICLLKSLGLSLETIKEILISENQNKIITTLLTEQSKQIKSELAEKTTKLKAIDIIVKNINSKNSIPLNLITDIDTMMKEKNKLKKTYLKMSIIAIIMFTIQIGTLIYAVMQGKWLPFGVGMALVILLSILLLRMYYKNTSYICPHCNSKFKPRLSEFMFANHTPKTRKLTCTTCGKKDCCIETSSK